MNGFSYLEKKWGFIIHYTIAFFIGGNLIVVLLFLYLDDWKITEDITSRFQGLNLVLNLIGYLFCGFLLASGAWNKKNKRKDSDL